MTRIRWEISDKLSPLHAARCWAAGLRGIDPALNEKVAQPLAELTKRLAALEVDLETFWSRLVATGATGATDQDACRLALVSAGLGELTFDTSASAILNGLADTRLAYQERYPKSSQQLSLRARPIREQWDGYGAGLLRRIAKKTHESFIPKTVTCVLLSPYRGGDGNCDPTTATLWMEAVLTNPVATVPEVLRLVWLITRIGIGARVLPIEGGGAAGENPMRAATVLALASLPVVLDAACYLEMTQSPTVTAALIDSAIQAWFGPMESTVVETVEKWWSQSEQLNPPFPVALKALDRMLPGKPSLQLGAST
jgi:hypothetical protein